MNLALHGFLLQVFVSILDFRHGRLLCSAGEPGYLDFDNLPETNFSCQGKVIGGYYADVEAGCQMFHVCTIGQKDEIMDIKFLCLNGTVFDQETRVCERVDEVDCSKSERFYNLNLELYGNNAVTLSLHESDDEDDLTIDPVEDHQARTTSARPSTTSTTSTTTSRPSKPSTTAASGSFQHPSGYPQHYQPQPPFPQVHTSQSKSLYDDKNGGYHHQYIYHNGGERANNQATSYQLFSSQGAVSSTTVPPAPPPPPPPQIHQIRYSSTVGPPPQILHSEPSTVTPLFHATSSTIQTLLNSNANSPAALINPIFHNHGIASTTEQFAVHSNNPRETADYGDDDDDDDDDDTDQEQDIRTLEAIQSANKGKISKLTISPVPSQQESSRTLQTKTSQTSQKQQQRISGNFLPTPATVGTTMRSFYPTPKPSPKPSQSQSITHQVTQHIHVSPLSQLKPHQITISLPDIQRIVQNPSPLLPSQSRVIVTAKASVSDESGRPLNTTQLVTLPLPTIPASYDDYKEGDESFDPFYRDVPKIRKGRRNVEEPNIRRRAKRSLEQPYRFIYDIDGGLNEELKTRKSESNRNENNAMIKEGAQISIEEFRALKESLLKFRDILFSGETSKDISRHDDRKTENNTDRVRNETLDATLVKQSENNIIKKVDYLEDLKTEGSKHLELNRNANKNEEDEISRENLSRIKVNKSLGKEKHVKNTSELEIDFYSESTTARSRRNESHGDVIDLIILDNDFKVKTAKTDAPIEIVIERDAKSETLSKNNEKVAHKGQIGRYLIKDESEKRSNFVGIESGRQVISQQSAKQKTAKNSEERKPGPRRKSSRLRSSKSRISSRIRQQRMENVEVTDAVQQKEKIERTITTSTVATVSVPTVASTTAVISSDETFKTSNAEQIDSNIFGESDAQTFKEVDTRAIGQRDATYSKSLRDGKSEDAIRNKESERSFDRQIGMKSRATNSELHFDKKEEQQTESVYTRSTDKIDVTFTENPRSLDLRSTEVARGSEDKKSSNEQFSYKEYVFPDDEEIEENSQDVPDKIFSDEAVTSHEDSLKQEEPSYRENISEKLSTDVLDEEQSSTVRYSEEVDSKELKDSQDTTESSAENTHSIQEESRSTEGSTSLADYVNPEEYTDSQEDVMVSTEEASSTDFSTEGVLKFTDELPTSEVDDQEDGETSEEISRPNESSEHDYVDDNYEPDNYKGTETTTELYESEEEDKDEDESDTLAKNLERKNAERQKIDDSVEVKTQTEYAAGVTHAKDFQEIARLTTTPSITTAALITTLSTTTLSTTTELATTELATMESTTTESATTESTTMTPTTMMLTTITSTTAASTTAASTTAASTTAASTTAASTTAASTTAASTTAASTTTESTTTSSTTARTRRPTTTTPRATPPKLFKPTGNRRIYAYIPPTTTPVPVVIKPRLGLYNPKPAKPPRSYNELAPKPAIRKLVLSRKPITTTVATTTVVTTTENVNTENPEMTTELVTMTATTAEATTTVTTEASTKETSTTETSTIEASTTETLTTEASTAEASTLETLTTTTMTTESSRSEENSLESKLEARDHVSLDSSTKNDQTNKEDQLSSPSEQNVPVNSSDVDSKSTIAEVDSFTPYPLSKLSTLAFSTEQTTKRENTEPQKATVTANIFVTTLSPTTLLSEDSQYAELTSSTARYLETETTTATSASTAYLLETSPISSVPPIPERATSVSILTTVLPKVEDADPVASMEAAILRSSNRKHANSRKPPFNCLEKEMYRFYGDVRDCRLFHYCSPGFTSRQVLDFRFVCEEGTAFDEVTQSCRHDVRNRKCRHRW